MFVFDQTFFFIFSWNFLSFLFLIEQMSPSSVRTKLNQKGTIHNDITLFYFKSNLYVIFPTEFVWDTSFWLVPNMCYRVALTISMLLGNEHGAKTMFKPIFDKHIFSLDPLLNVLSVTSTINGIKRD